MWTPRLDDPKNAAEPAFRRIVQSLADDVQAGALPAGTRLPTHRDLADALGLSRGTVARAYQEAHQLGLIRSEVGRGTHVPAPDQGDRAYSSLLLPPTVVRDLSTNLPLAGIDPDPAGVFRKLAARPDRMSLFRYHPPFGVHRHRLAGVGWLRRMGVEAEVDDVVLGAGAQHALFVTISHLAARIAAIYVEELTYPGMHGIAEAVGLPLVPVAMDAEGMTPTGLERAVRRGGPGVVYTMPTIHNPTGAVMSEARRAALAAIARAKGLFLIEDAANRMLHPRPPPPLRRYAPERTFLCASVSKVLSPGLRVAFLVGPRAELAAIGRRVWATSWMVGPIGAEMVAMWLEEGVVDETLRRKRKEAARRQAVAARVFGKGALLAHKNALHAWLRLPAYWDGERFVAEAARQSLVVTSSSAFWARPTPPPRAVRIALGAVDDLEALESGLRRLAKIAAS